MFRKTIFTQNGLLNFRFEVLNFFFFYAGFFPLCGFLLCITVSANVTHHPVYTMCSTAKQVQTG